MASRFFELLATRRSIKAYLPQEVPENIILCALDAARSAPSAHNAQPWRFIVMRDGESKRKLAEAMAEEWDRDLTRDQVPSDIRKRLVGDSLKRFVHAPVLIIASITMKDMDRYPDGRRQGIEHLMATQSLAASVQNVLLAAHSEGLSSCWFCAPLFCQDAVRKVLGMPRDVEPQALITLGYPAVKVDMPTRRPLEEVAFKEYWGGKF